MNKTISRLICIFLAIALVLPCSLITLAAEDLTEGPFGWGTKYMNLDDEIIRHTPAAGYSGGNVTIAVIDSGIDITHDAFDGKTISPLSKDFTGSVNGIADEDIYGHGTSVAGIIAESTPDNAELMILKTYPKDNSSTIDLDIVNQAIRYAVDNGADVINLSMATDPLSGQGGLDADSETIIRNLEAQLKYAEDNGVIVCAASGNRYSDIDKTYVYPARSPHTIAVGAIDTEGNKADFSNYGQSLDFCAPGVNVAVAAINTGYQYYVPINNVELCAGTSFAAPYIAACCAFIKMDDRSAGKDEALEILKSKCIDYGTTGWDPYYGWGMPHFDDYVDEQAAEAAEREAAARAAAEAAEARARATTSVAISSGTVNQDSIIAAISAAGGRNEYVTELVLGKGVKKISKGALAGTNITTLVVQSKKLKKKSVKGSLKNSAVKTVKVQVGKAKDNKKYVKKYKTIFTKKNAGKKVKVKK